MKNLLLKYGLPAFAIFSFIFAMVVVFSPPKYKRPESAHKPPVTSFDNRIAGLGITEPNSETISVGTNIAGIITEIFVKEGDYVKKDNPLFKIDDRKTLASLKSAKAKLAITIVEKKEADNQFSYYQRIEDQRAISENEFSQKEYAALLASERVKEAEAQVNSFQTELELLTVRAPIDGTILRINIHDGEFATTGTLNTPLMVMGDIHPMFIRVEVDESEIMRFSPNSEAYGILRSAENTKIPLIFIRKVPFLQQKRTLSSDARELIDTRVQEFLYSFNNQNIGASIGQQMDVYIQASTVASPDEL